MKNKNVSFVQMADPQFGMYSSVSKFSDADKAERRQRGINIEYTGPILEGLAKETSLFTEAIETANKINPDFVVICGDMVHNSDSDEQFQELIRISRLLNEDIKLYWVAGNHDVGDKPTRAGLAQYKEQFGEYNYSFQEENCYFIVLNSSICYDPGSVPDEWNILISFLEKELQIAASVQQRHKIIFMHHPLYLNDPNEGDNYFVIPSARRAKIIDLITEYDVSAVFTGHLHRNNYKKIGNTELVSTGPVGFPLGEDPSGIRHVRVDDNSLTHEYLGLIS
jgi:predicted phosphodiesterase|tara:strand:- start:352 stop:1191 length:840 start_codon:yes stop_codon:yes gene_type:complete